MATPAPNSTTASVNSGQKRVILSTIGTRIKSRIDQQNAARIEAEKAFASANFQDREGNLYAYSYEQQDNSVPASFQKPNFSSKEYGGEAYAAPPDSRQYAFPSRSEFIKQDIEQQISNRENSKLLWVLPNPVDRAEAVILRKERDAAPNTPQWLRNVESQLPVFSIYEKKVDVANIKYDRIKSLRKQGISPSRNTGFQVQSAVLDYTSSPLRVGSDVVIGVGTGYGAGKALNYVGRKTGSVGFNRAAVLLGGVGVGAAGVGGYSSYKSGGAYGLTSFGLSTAVGTAGAVHGFGLSKPGEPITRVSNVKGSKSVIDTTDYVDGGGSVNIFSKGLVQVEGTSFGRYFKTNVPQDLFLYGARSDGVFSVAGKGTSKVTTPGGKNLLFQDTYTGKIKGGFAAIESGKGELFISKTKPTKVLSSFEDSFSGKKQVLSNTKGIYGVFKSGELQDAGGTVGNKVTTTYGSNFFESPVKQASRSNSATVGVGGRNYFPESLYNKGNVLLKGNDFINVKPDKLSVGRINKKGSLNFGSNKDYFSGESSNNQLSKFVGETKVKRPSPSFEGLPSVITTTRPSSLLLPVSSLKSFSNNKGFLSVGSLPKISLTNNNKNIFEPIFSSRQVQVPVQKQTPVYFIGQKQRIVPLTEQKQQVVPIQPFIPISPIPDTPFVPGGLPLIPFGLPTSFGSKETGSKGRNFQYIPSLTAVLGNIRGSAPSNLGGFEIRPLKSLKKTKSKRKK